MSFQNAQDEDARSKEQARAAAATRAATPRVILTIAGSDSSAGAGIQADLKTISACGGYGATVITAVTAQNTCGVREVLEMPPDLVSAQIAAIFDDLDVAAIKTGMLASADVVRTVARELRSHRAGPVVVDPVMIAKGGHALLRDDAVECLRKEMLPLATLTTPNRLEAERLAGMPVQRLEDAEAAGRAILRSGCAAVLVKGGHLETQLAVDVLVTADGVEVFEASRIRTAHTHGTGCTLSAAIATYLGRGAGLSAAIRAAKLYVTEAIRDGLALGAGHGPTDHFFYLRRPNPVAWMDKLAAAGELPSASGPASGRVAKPAPTGEER